MSDKDLVNKLGDLFLRYRMRHLGKRLSFKKFMEWVESLHE